MSVQLIELPLLPSTLDTTAYLRLGRSGANTILERSFATNPLKVLTTRGVSQTCWMYAATYGGGIVGGDAIRMTVEVGNGARGVLTTQASTKVYRSLRPSTQHLSAAIEDEALLAVLPDPVVCFAGAHFSQHQRYDLSQHASLVLIDWISSGRHANGERWAFDHYSSRIDIHRAGRRIVYDALVLDARDAPVAERLGTFEVGLTAAITGPLVSVAAGEILRGLSAPALDRTLVTTAWMLTDGGLMLRASGTSVEQVGAELRTRLSFLKTLLGEDPWTRKW